MGPLKYLNDHASVLVAINICFSMTEVFRSEVLGAFMNQIVDEPVLPTLFLRTVRRSRSE